MPHDHVLIVVSILLRLLVFSFCVLFQAFTVTASDGTPQSCLKINILPDLVDTQKAVERFKPIFDEAGICSQFVSMPVRRSELAIQNGQLDGELLRTRVWANMFKGQVVHVPTPIHVAQMVAISLREKQLKLVSLADLRGRRVVITWGHRWSEAKMAELGVSLIKASSAQRFLESLRFEQAELGFVECSLVPLLKDLSDFQIDPIVPLPYHIVLHRRHQALVPALDAALQVFHDTAAQ